MKTFSRILTQSLVWRGVYFVTLFLTNLLLSRTLGAAESGFVFYISNTFAFVQLVAGLSLENGITYFGAGKTIPSNYLFWFCLGWTAIVAVLQIICFYSLDAFGISGNSTHFYQYGFLFITGWLLIIYASNLFYSEGNFFIPNVVQAIAQVCLIIILLTNQKIIFLSQQFLITLYFTSFFFQGLSISFLYAVQHKSWQQFALPSRTDTVKFIRYSLKVLLFNVLLFLVYRIDYVFVKHSSAASASDLGNYIQASKLGQMMLVIPQVIGSAVYPQVSSGYDLHSVKNMIMLLAKLLAIMFLLVFLFLCLFGNVFFPWLLGETFQNVQVPLLLLMPGIYGLSLMSFLSNFFSGRGQVFVSVRAALIALIIMITGNSLFVNRYGIPAAAIVSSISYLSMFGFYVIPFQKETGLPWQALFYWRKADWQTAKNMLSLQSFFKK